MNLAIFDLDNTLLDGDSDYSWGCFLAEIGAVDSKEYQLTNEKFYTQYREGNLDINAFLEFALKPLAQYPLDKLLRWRAQFMEQYIEKMILPKGKALIQTHIAQGHATMIITATNRFVTEPIAKRLGVDHLLATEPEMQNDAYTGKVYGVPCFQQGKIQRLKEWQHMQKSPIAEMWFYSDSHNDIPLLEHVNHPIAVDPDPILKAHAINKTWKIISLK